jgi:tetratricopeptide (TPR) repeat protein
VVGLEKLRQAVAMLEKPDGDDPDREAQLALVSAQLGSMLYFNGDLDEALGAAERALQIAEIVDVPNAFVLALNTRANILASRDRRDEAVLLLEGALRFANTRSVDTDHLQTVQVNLASALEEADRLEACLEHYQQSEALARRLGDRLGAVFARLTRANALLELGRWDEYADLYREHVENDAPELTTDLTLSNLVTGVVWLQLRRGDLEGARAVIGQSADNVLSGVEQRGILDAARAALASAEGRAADALTTAESGLRACLEQSFPVVACLNLVEAVDAAFALRRDEKVQELIDAVRAHYRPGRQPAIDAHIHRWRAALAGRRGDDVDAADQFAMALEGFAALTRPFWLAVTQLEFAEWLLHNERDTEAAELLVGARSAFTQLGAEPWIERVDAAVRARGATAAVARPAV